MPAWVNESSNADFFKSKTTRIDEEKDTHFSSSTTISQMSNKSIKPRKKGIPPKHPNSKEHQQFQKSICINPLCRKKWKVMSKEAKKFTVFCPTCRRRFEKALDSPIDSQKVLKVWSEIYSNLAMITDYKLELFDKEIFHEISSFEKITSEQYSHLFSKMWPSANQVNNENSTRYQRVKSRVEIVDKIGSHLLLISPRTLQVDTSGINDESDSLCSSSLYTPSLTNSVSSRGRSSNFLKRLQNIKLLPVLDIENAYQVGDNIDCLIYANPSSGERDAIPCIVRMYSKSDKSPLLKQASSDASTAVPVGVVEKARVVSPINVMTPQVIVETNKQTVRQTSKTPPFDLMSPLSHSFLVDHMGTDKNLTLCSVSPLNTVFLRSRSAPSTPEPSRKVNQSLQRVLPKTPHVTPTLVPEILDTSYHLSNESTTGVLDHRPTHIGDEFDDLMDWATDESRNKDVSKISAPRHDDGTRERANSHVEPTTFMTHPRGVHIQPMMAPPNFQPYPLYHPTYQVPIGWIPPRTRDIVSDKDIPDTPASPIHLHHKLNFHRHHDSVLYAPDHGHATHTPRSIRTINQDARSLVSGYTGSCESIYARLDHQERCQRDIEKKLHVIESHLDILLSHFNIKPPK